MNKKVNQASQDEAVLNEATKTDEQKQDLTQGPQTVAQPAKKERHYYIDWLRSCDVHCVVVLHTIYTTDVVTG